MPLSNPRKLWCFAMLLVCLCGCEDGDSLIHCKKGDVLLGKREKLLLVDAFIDIRKACDIVLSQNNELKQVSSVLMLEEQINRAVRLLEILGIKEGREGES